MNIISRQYYKVNIFSQKRMNVILVQCSKRMIAVQCYFVVVGHDCGPSAHFCTNWAIRWWPCITRFRSVPSHSSFLAALPRSRRNHPAPVPSSGSPWPACIGCNAARFHRCESGRNFGETGRWTNPGKRKTWLDCGTEWQSDWLADIHTVKAIPSSDWLTTTAAQVMVTSLSWNRPWNFRMVRSREMSIRNWFSIRWSRTPHYSKAIIVSGDGIFYCLIE